MYKSHFHRERFHGDERIKEPQRAISACSNNTAQTACSSKVGQVGYAVGAARPFAGPGTIHREGYLETVWLNHT